MPLAIVGKIIQRERNLDFPEEDFAICGRNPLKGGLSITGQNDPLFAKPGEFPHMCIIYKKTGGTRVYVAGASLIAPNMVLTVAHKFWT